LNFTSEKIDILNYAASFYRYNSKENITCTEAVALLGSQIFR